MINICLKTLGGISTAKNIKAFIKLNICLKTLEGISAAKISE